MHYFRRGPTNDIDSDIPSKRVGKYNALFVVLQVLGGQIGLPLFIATMLIAPNVKKHLTLVNFFLSWIIYSIVYCLAYVALHCS